MGGLSLLGSYRYEVLCSAGGMALSALMSMRDLSYISKDTKYMCCNSQSDNHDHQRFFGWTYSMPGTCGIVSCQSLCHVQLADVLWLWLRVYFHYT